MMIDMIKTALPNRETLLCLYREVIQFRQQLGFGYDKIHACKNGCVLFLERTCRQSGMPKVQHLKVDWWQRQEK